MHEPRPPWAKKTPRQTRARATFDAILDAAAQLLAQSDTPTTNQVAERAGVSIGTLYQYFANKEAIFGSLGDRVIRAATRRTLRQVDQLRDHPNIAHALERIVRDAVERRRTPLVRRLLTLATRHGYDVGMHTYLDMLDAEIREAVADRPEIEATDIGVALMLRALSGALAYGADQTDWLDAPAAREKVVEELTLMLHSYLTADRAAWALRPREGG